MLTSDGPLAVNNEVRETFNLSLVALSGTKVGWAMKEQGLTKVAVGANINVGSIYYVTNIATPSGVQAGCFMYVVDEGTVKGTRKPIIKFDSGSHVKKEFTGFWFDQATNDFYWTREKVINKKNGITIPAGAGTVEDVSTPSLAKTLPYKEAVCQQFADAGPTENLFFTRLDSIAGVDLLKRDFTGSVTPVLDGSIVTLVLANSATASFSTETKYYYKTCFLYDGYQHSTLSAGFTGPRGNTGAGIQWATTLTITLNDVGAIPDRVTDLVLFRSRSPYTDIVPDEFYRQVDQISLGDQRWVVTGNVAVLTIEDTVEDVGQSYEAITGMPEPLVDSMVNYNYGVRLNNQLFVVKCFQEDIADASHFLYRSKEGRFDMFDWTTDFLRLPFVPVAIASFAGRIWVFDTNRVLAIHPVGLYIEDDFHGVGADNYRCVLPMESGMYVCNKNGIWVCDGRRFQPISEAILTTTSSILTTYGWKNLTHTNYSPFIVGFSKDNSVLFCVSATPGTGDNHAYVYNYSRNRWDFWKFKDSTSGSSTQRGNIGGFTGKDGEAYISMYNSVQKIATDVARKIFTWTSRKFNLGDASQIKKFYKILVESTDTSATAILTTEYALNSLESFGTLPADGVLPDTDWRNKAIQVKMTTSGANAGNVKVRSLSLLFRRMIGKR
jgi:hypothetical protein